MSLKFLSLLALLYLTIAVCPVNQGIDNLSSGTVTFTSTAMGSESFKQNFQNSFAVAPRIALGLQHFDVKSGNTGNFSITAWSITQNDVTFRFTRPEVWNKLRINYFASLKNDLVIGTGYSQFGGIYNTTAVSVVRFDTDIPNYTRSIMRVYLNGYQYKGSVIDIQLTGRTIDVRQLSISIDVENDFYLTKLYYSFVIFAPSNVAFASYGGLIAETNFTGIYYEDAHKIIYNSNYQLYGLNKITLSGNSPIQFASLIDQNQIAGVYSSRNFDQFNLIYVILGVAPLNACTQCNASIYAYGSSCVDLCPANSYPFQYKDKGSACRVCPSKLNQVLNNGKCVCDSNSYLVDSLCVSTTNQPYNFLDSKYYGIASQNAPQSASSSNSNSNLVASNSNSSVTSNVVISNPINTVPIPVSVVTNGSCTSQFQYWTGYRCACKVGYKSEASSTQCVPLTLLKTKGWVVRQPAIQPEQNNSTDSNTNNPEVVNLNCYLQYEYFNGMGCVCINNYIRVSGLCVLDSNSNSINQATCIAQANKEWVNNSCVCKSGFTAVNGNCLENQSNSTIACPQNSVNNGLNVCVCVSGYYKDSITQNCLKGTPCPPSSTRNSNGSCICDAGLIQVDGYCTKCPLNSIWDSNSSKCVYVCGLNAQYSQTLQQCQCLAGYGIFGKVCSQCPVNYFIKSNYCVQCPINSVYNSQTDKCECNNGYRVAANGFCMKICADNQIYSTENATCTCLAGLGRISVNASCQVCPVGTVPSKTTQICGGCGANQELINGVCQCKIGFTYNTFGVCSACGQVPNTFLVNNVCASCPGQLILNSNTTKCECGVGKFKVGINCFDTCKTDQLVDLNNICYSCPVNQIIDNGKCVCQNSYVRNTVTSRCQLNCKANQFIYKERCASCPATQLYRPEINGCACANGMYLNTFGVCEKVVLQAIQCSLGYFFDSNNGCTVCPSACSACSSANACTACSQSGFTAVSGKCQSLCGDGIIVGTQSCDDKNTNDNDGCSSTCVIQPLFTCTGQPSVCRYGGPIVCGNGRVQGNEACDDGNLINGDGCSSTCQKQSVTTAFGNITLYADPNTNINNVFVVLRVAKKYTFANQNQMEGFVKTSFPDSVSIPTVYCSQRVAPDLDLFDCLAIYSSGIPNKKYSIIFSFDYNGDKGKIQVDIDPLKSSIPTRSIRPSS